MKLFRILHLSDIHIGNTYMDSEDIAYRIISDIEPEIHIMDTQNLLKSKGRTMVFIEFSRCTGTYSSAKFEYFIKIAINNF